MIPISRRLLLLGACVVAPLVPVVPASGQGSPRPLPEVRVDVVSGRSTAVQAGVGMILASGTYTRYVLAGGVGPAWKSGSSAMSGRVDLQARFLLDPYRESRWGLYGVAGVSGLYDRYERWRVRLEVAAGIESPPSARGAWALELGLGGGVRVGVVLRRLGLGRR
jgi:hypothetical protein